jgi:hypothetical protein
VSSGRSTWRRHPTACGCSLHPTASRSVACSRCYR